MKHPVASATALAVSLAFAAPATAQQAKPAPVADLVNRVDIPYQQFTLQNGLKVLVHTDRKAPIVAVSVWYDVGSKHEPKGKTGFAHLFEHLMFNGSENAPGDFFEPLRQVGATDFNGTTSFDRTNYFETVPRPALDRALFLESDRMGYLLGAITQDVLDGQRGVVQNEKRQGDNRPYGLHYYKLLAGLFPDGHPYSHSPIGSMADLDAASLDDVKSWFRTHYGPNNAVLVLAGDVDVAEARPLVEKYFGAIPRGPETVAPQVTIPTLKAPVSEVMKDRVAATMIVKAWAVPGLNDADSVPLDVSATVLGGLASSRLDNILVRQEKLAVQVSAGVQGLTQAGIFVVQAIVRPGVDAALVEKRLDAIVADYIRTGPSADEVQRVATNVASGTIFGLESVGGFGGKAVALAQGALHFDDGDRYKKRLQEYAALTPARVQAAAQKWLSRPVYTITVEPGAREAYVEAGQAPATTPGAKAPETKTSAPASAEGPAKGARGALPQVGSIGDLKFPDVQRARLSNGIELVYAQRTAVPITQLSLSFDAGAAADPAGKLGTQALTLSMLDEGTKRLDSTRLAEARERLGASFGTGSGPDRTYLTFSSPSANLAGSLDLFAEVVQQPAFAPAEVERLRTSLLAGIAQQMASPEGMAQRTVPTLLYGPASPYAKLAAGNGDPAAVQRLTRDDLLAFYNAWIRPDKAKIFIISDRPLAEVKALLDKSFGSWRATGAAGVKDFSAAAQQAAPKIVLLDRPDSPQSIIIASQLLPVRATQELLPLLTANEVLGSGFLSRINMDLREAKRWSYGSSGSVGRLEHAVAYSINAPVQADKTGAAIAALRTQVGDFLGSKGITPAEFERTINGETRELAGNFETSAAVLSAMQVNDLYKRPDDYYDGIAAKYRALTIPQLDSAARGVIDPSKFVWVVVGDAAKVKPQLEGLGLPVEVRTAPAEAKK